MSPTATGGYAELGRNEFDLSSQELRGAVRDLRRIARGQINGVRPCPQHFRPTFQVILKARRNEVGLGEYLNLRTQRVLEFFSMIG